METKKQNDKGVCTMAFVVFGLIGALTSTWKYGSDGNYIATFIVMFILCGAFSALLCRLAS